MSYELAYRFWYFANDNGGHRKRAFQHKPPDYPGIAALQMILAILRGEIDIDEFIDIDDDGPHYPPASNDDGPHPRRVMIVHRQNIGDFP